MAKGPGRAGGGFNGPGKRHPDAVMVPRSSPEDNASKAEERRLLGRQKTLEEDERGYQETLAIYDRSVREVEELIAGMKAGGAEHLSEYSIKQAALVENTKNRDAYVAEKKRERDTRVKELKSIDARIEVLRTPKPVPTEVTSPPDEREKVVPLQPQPVEQVETRQRAKDGLAFPKMGKERISVSEKEVRKELKMFLIRNAGLMTQLVTQLSELETKGEELSEEKREAIENLVDSIIGNLQKNAGKNKKLKESVPSRETLVEFAENYIHNVNQLRDVIPVPETEKAREAMFRNLTQSLLVRPETELKTTDPLIAAVQSRLQTTRRPGKVATYPKGSGAGAAIEKTGIRQASELALSWTETSLASVGVALAIARLLYGPAYMVTAPIKTVSIIIGVIISYVLNLPLKNAIIQEILQTGKVMPALMKVADKHKVGTFSILATTFLVTSTAFDDSMEKALTSQAASKEIAKAVGETEERLAVAKGLKLTEKGEEVGKVSINSVFNISDQLFSDHERNLKQQVDAGLDAELDPDKITELQKRFPGMSFGQSGNGGDGPLYYSKRALFLGEEFNAKVPGNYREIVLDARREAGLLDENGKSLSLAEGQEKLYQEYLNAITAPIERDDTKEDESHRARVLRLLAEIQELQGKLKGQNFATAFVGAAFHGEAPVNPEAIAHKQKLLKEEFKAIGTLYGEFHGKAETQIKTVQEASNSLLEGSELSLQVPEFSFADALAPVLEVTPTQKDPRVTTISGFLAENLGGEAKEYIFAAQGINKVASVLLSMGIIFGPTLLFGFSFRSRGRRTREDQPFHVEDLRKVEEEQVDELEATINEKVAPFLPGFPRVNRLRIRIALREFIAKKVVELSDSPEMGKKTKDWMITEFLKPGQVSPDTKVLQGFGKVLDKLRGDPKYGAEFFETIFPGYARLMKGMQGDLDVMSLMARKEDEPITPKDQEFIRKRLGSAQNYQETMDQVRFESAYAHLARELADSDVEYKCLEHILSDIKVGADTYKVFGRGSEGETVVAAENRGITNIINAQQYRWTPAGGPGFIHQEHQRVMRQVAEDVAGTTEIQHAMAENIRHRETVRARLKKLQEVMVSHQLKTPNAQKRTLSLPKTVLDGDVASLRDELSVGAGIFNDVAHDVRRRLQGVPREGIVQDKTFSVEVQLNEIAKQFYASSRYKRLVTDLQREWGTEGALQPDLLLVYSKKAKRALDGSSEVDVPGFSLRVRLLKPNGEELRLDDDGKEIKVTEDTRADAQDFQMSKQLLTNSDPMRSAGSFIAWASGSLKNLRTKATKNWLREKYLQGDRNRRKESQFQLPSSREEAKQWLDNFYTRKALAYKRADRARVLLQKDSIVNEDLEEDFFKNDPTYGRIPPRDQVERVLDLYYGKINKKGLGRISASIDRTRGLKLDLSEVGTVEVAGKKSMKLAEYR